MNEKGVIGKIIWAEGEYLHLLESGYFVDRQTGEETWRKKIALNPIYYLPHTLNPLLSITGGRVTHVSCMGAKPQSYYMEGYAARDIQVALMRVDNDTIFRVAVGFTSSHGPRKETNFHWYQLKGSHGSVEWSRSDRDKPKMWLAAEGAWREMEWSIAVEGADDYMKSSGHGGSDGWPVDNFLKAIVYGAAVEMDVYAAVECAAPAIMAVESSNEGGILKEIPDFRKRG